VSDISAASERVQDGVQGWHVKAGDADDLARLLTLTKDGARVRDAGRAAYEAFWTSPPTRENHTQGLLMIYAQVLEAGAKGRLKAG
jgi:hypothetical protein